MLIQLQLVLKFGFFLNKCRNYELFTTSGLNSRSQGGWVTYLPGRGRGKSSFLPGPSGGGGGEEEWRFKSPIHLAGGSGEDRGRAGHHTSENITFPRTTYENSPRVLFNMNRWFKSG